MPNPTSSKAPDCCGCCDSDPHALIASLSGPADCGLNGYTAELNGGQHFWSESSLVYMDLACSECVEPLGYHFRVFAGADHVGATKLRVVTCDPLRLEGSLTMVKIQNVPESWCEGQTLNVVIVQGPPEPLLE